MNQTGKLTRIIKEMKKKLFSNGMTINELCKTVEDIIEDVLESSADSPGLDLLEEIYVDKLGFFISEDSLMWEVHVDYKVINHNEEFLRYVVEVTRIY